MFFSNFDALQNFYTKTWSLNVVSLLINCLKENRGEISRNKISCKCFEMKNVLLNVLQVAFRDFERLAQGWKVKGY